MKKHIRLLILALSLFHCLFPGLAHVEAGQGTVVPKGVTEIDLRTIVGDGAADVRAAWMPNADICILLRSQPEDKAGNKWAFRHEVIILDMREHLVLSRTPVPLASRDYQRSWEDGTFQLWFAPAEDAHDGQTLGIDGAEGTYLCVSISPDGAVDIHESARSAVTVMPGGQIGIRTAIDGSLIAVDLGTGAERRLIQGIPSALWEPNTPEVFTTEAALQAYAEYVPCWDELVDWDDEWGLDFYNTREFRLHQALDEHRFLYTARSWEGNAGFGVYDLRTYRDHRITGRGDFFGIAGDMLFGETLKADANTYDAAMLPELVHEQLEAAAREDTSAPVDCAISPDGRMLALTGMIARSAEEKDWWAAKDTEPRFDYAHTVTLTDIQTGALIKAYDIDNPLAVESTVTFYDDTHLMLFCQPEEQDGSAYLYLINTAECAKDAS